GRRARTDGAFNLGASLIFDLRWHAAGEPGVGPAIRGLDSERVVIPVGHVPGVLRSFELLGLVEWPVILDLEVLDLEVLARPDDHPDALPWDFDVHFVGSGFRDGDDL